MGLEDRIIFDDGTKQIPKSLSIDYVPVNRQLKIWRDRSIEFIRKSLEV